MKFVKFNVGKTWEECLGIYLFVKIKLNNIDYKSLTLKDYGHFELNDFEVRMFNTWIGHGGNDDRVLAWVGSNKEQIQTFIENFGSTYKPKVILWGDRDKTSYYKEKLQLSFEFEEFLEDFFKQKYGLDLHPFITPEEQYYKGENEAGIEIKHDMVYKKTGNLYIEYAEKSKEDNSSWIDSGIKKEDNSTYFLIGDFDQFWIFKKQRLLEIFDEEKRLKKEGKTSPRHIKFIVKLTSLGFIYPIRYAEKEELNIDEVVQTLKALQ